MYIYIYIKYNVIFLALFYVHALLIIFVCSILPVTKLYAQRLIFEIYFNLNPIFIPSFMLTFPIII